MSKVGQYLVLGGWMFWLPEVKGEIILNSLNIFFLAMNHQQPLLTNCYSLCATVSYFSCIRSLAFSRHKELTYILVFRWFLIFDSSHTTSRRLLQRGCTMQWRNWVLFLFHCIVTPVLCDLSREDWNMVTYDMWFLIQVYLIRNALE